VLLPDGSRLDPQAEGLDPRQKRKCPKGRAPRAAKAVRVAKADCEIEVSSPLRGWVLSDRESNHQLMSRWTIMQLAADRTFSWRPNFQMPGRPAGETVPHRPIVGNPGPVFARGASISPTSCIQTAPVRR
jgi:hypothetical protein